MSKISNTQQGRSSPNPSELQANFTIPFVKTTVYDNHASIIKNDFYIDKKRKYFSAFLCSPYYDIFNLSLC